MVFVKVRETYDLATVKDKMTVIGIHTPKPDIIKRNYPGLLMQCRAYRPVSCDVKVACASMLPMDPLGVGTTDGAVSPEDIFNPILYKAMSNKGMSQLEARINMLDSQLGVDINGSSAAIDVDTITHSGGNVDQFKMYYALLSDTNSWKHANPQSGLSMNGLKPLVYEMVYNIGDVSDQMQNGDVSSGRPGFPQAATSSVSQVNYQSVIGKAKPFPFLNCTSYTFNYSASSGTYATPGFASEGNVFNAEQAIPWLKCYVGAIIVPPSKLHQLFYRMVIEWTIEFSSIRSLSEITNFLGMAYVSDVSHYQSYSYESAKAAITGSEETILEKDTCMVSANVDVNKVM